MSSEILVYQNLPHTKYRWLIYISYMQAAFLLANFCTMPSPSLVRERDKLALERAKQKKLDQSQFEDESDKASTVPGFIAEEKISFFDLFKGFRLRELLSYQNLVENVREKPVQALAYASASVAIISSLRIYTSRCVHKIFLLPNDRARFVFFSPMPFKQGSVVEMDLKNIACISARDSQYTYSILKFRDMLGYRLVNRKEGEFLKPKLYDENFGFQRSWYKK